MRRISSPRRIWIISTNKYVKCMWHHNYQFRFGYSLNLWLCMLVWHKATRLNTLSSGNKFYFICFIDIAKIDYVNEVCVLFSIKLIKIRMRLIVKVGWMLVNRRNWTMLWWWQAYDQSIGACLLEVYLIYKRIAEAFLLYV